MAFLLDKILQWEMQIRDQGDNLSIEWMNKWHKYPIY
jgi:hypothetical protein